MKPVRFEPLAEIELAEAVDYYDGKLPRLGDKFLEQVWSVVEQIEAFPESSQVFRGRLRRAPIPRFPYFLIYCLHDTAIDVVAVMHQRRGPKYIADRIQNCS